MYRTVQLQALNSLILVKTEEVVGKYYLSHFEIKATLYFRQGNEG
jgi:hypothetical protein